jgi:hypothetical protein
MWLVQQLVKFENEVYYRRSYLLVVLIVINVIFITTLLIKRTVARRTKSPQIHNAHTTGYERQLNNAARGQLNY